MIGVYDPGLVVLSLAVAIMTAYVAQGLVARADDAMYAAKDAGRSGYRFAADTTAKG